MTVRVLVTGGTGKTGRRLAKLLRDHKADHRIASRWPAADTVTFDWTRRETWRAALDDVAAVYLVVPPVGAEATDLVIDFVEQAQACGAQRFVLLSASLVPAGGPGMGKVHQHLQNHAPQWCVLRPSWFMQNFSEGQHLQTIREEGAIYSATSGGRVPFVSADDIAAAAFAALTQPDAPNRDLILTGPRAMTYDDAAEMIGATIGRRVRRVGISVDELARRQHARGMSEMAARVLAAMDGAIAAGAENRTTDGVELLTGRAPISFEAFVNESRNVWIDQV